MRRSSFRFARTLVSDRLAATALRLAPPVEIGGRSRKQITAVGGAVAPLEETRVHDLRLGVAGALVLHEELLEDVQLELAGAFVDTKREHGGAVDLVQERGLGVELV